MMDFTPDVVVEVTKACDRMCRGCYAPNILINSSTPDHVRAGLAPSIFLEPLALETGLARLCGTSTVNGLAIRGGEPTLHPDLPLLLQKAAPYARSTYLETHGRWLVNPRAGDFRDNLMGALRRNSVILKISFDRMHQITAQKITDMVRIADAHGIRWTIAITEESESEAQNIRNEVDWVPDNQIFFQRKAKKSLDLVRPRLGTITSLGTIQARPTNRFEDQTEIRVP